MERLALYFLLCISLSIIIIMGCNNKAQKDLVIACEDGKIISYNALHKIPPIIKVKGPCNVYSEVYPITIHFPDPDNPSIFAQTGDFFREGNTARLNGTINKSRIYQIWFHSNQIRGAEYLNPVLNVAIIELK